MKRNIYLILPLILAFVLTSCEEIVKLDLDTTDPKLVIDATMAEDSLCVVYLTKTQDYYDNNDAPKVSDAVIRISDGTNTETLVETKAGVYQTLLMKGVVGRKYTIEVDSESKSYLAQALIPAPVPIQKMYVLLIEIGSQKVYSPTIIYMDPVGVKNFYYNVIYINGERSKAMNLNDDEFTKEGVPYPEAIRYRTMDDGKDDDESDLKVGDTIKVIKRSLDESSYNYFLSMLSIASGGATNPTSNFSNGALGCFNVYSVSSIELILKEEDILSKQQAEDLLNSLYGGR